MSKIIEPSVRRNSFSCPHCGSLATQYWYNLFAERVPVKDKVPHLVHKEEVERIKSRTDIPQEGKEIILGHLVPLLAGKPLIRNSDTRSDHLPLENVWASQCYACEEVAIWLYDKLIYPATLTAAMPNKDLSDEIKKDFNEARNIVALSPRGAAALLRLCVQKLCIHLGEQGKIDQMIGALVKKGLNPTVQKALDTVRVIGNEAVHPGEMELSDDTGTAEALFSLVNLIADQMISGPKAVNAMFSSLPEEKRKGIENRDRKNAQTEKA